MLKAGLVVEKGSHDELMSLQGGAGGAGGVYRSMWLLQQAEEKQALLLKKEKVLGLDSGQQQSISISPLVSLSAEEV